MPVTEESAAIALVEQLPVFCCSDLKLICEEAALSAKFSEGRVHLRYDSAILQINYRYVVMIAGMMARCKRACLHPSYSLWHWSCLSASPRFLESVDVSVNKIHVMMSQESG